MFILKEFCNREILLCNFLLHYLNSTPPSRVTRQIFLAMFTSVKSTERWVIGWWKLSMMVFAVLTLYRNVTDRRVSGFATCVASYAVARWKSWIWYIVDRFLTDAMNHRHAKNIPSRINVADDDLYTEPTSRREKFTDMCWLIWLVQKVTASSEAAHGSVILHVAFTLSANLDDDDPEWLQ